jgi:two-component system CheB/CheR fusion protein
LLVFSEQDLVKDPPFSKLDLISCRNLLIYMSGELQKKLMLLFHYALNPGGFLFLGTSETISQFTELYTTMDRKLKLYQRNEDVDGALRTARGRFLHTVTEDGIVPRTQGKTPGKDKFSLRELTEQALLQKYTPVGALVNARGDILYIHGRTGSYLEPAPGEAGIDNILKMAREGLRRELTTALRKAVASEKLVLCQGLRVKTNGNFTTINLTIQIVATDTDVALPGIVRAGGAPPMFLVVFEEVPAAYPERFAMTAVMDTVEGIDGDSTDSDARITALKRELHDKEEYLQTTNEELETLNEELKSSNEEMQSINEELQSTNEELETSKEELQSLNEELATVNAELQTKVSDLMRTNSDMNNLLAVTDIGTIFVDHHLHILRFTPAVTQIINLIQTDIGRPVTHIVSNLVGYDSLGSDVHEVLNSLIPKELELKTLTGTWYMMRILPYRTLDNVVEGAVITFADITEMKKTRESLQESESMSRLAVVVRDAHDAITVQDLNGRILAWNPAATSIYGWSEAEALTMNIRDLIPRSYWKKELTIIQQLGITRILEPYPTNRITKDGRLVKVLITATALVKEAGEIYAIATTERQIGSVEGRQNHD